MTPDQINESVWEYIKPAENALTPENSDGYNENEVYRAWNAGYQTACKEYQKDATTYNKQLQNKVDDLNDIIKDLRDQIEGNH